MSGDMEYFKTEITDIKDLLKEMNNNIKDNGKQINELKVGFGILRTEFCGETGNNGVKAQVKKNTTKIEEIKKGPGRFVKTYIPVIITVILFLFILSERITDWIKVSTKPEKVKTEVVTPGNGNP